MSTRKQREVLRQRKMAFDRVVEANRKIDDLSEEKPTPTKTSTAKKKTTTTKKKASQKAKG